jgi:hypothetical protein
MKKSKRSMHARRALSSPAKLTLHVGVLCSRPRAQLPPAHSPGDTVVVIPSARTAFVGDLLFLGTSPIMWQGPAQNVLDALQILEELDVDTYIPGHGPVTDVTTVRLLKEYWRFVQRCAGACTYARTPKLECGRNAIGFLDTVVRASGARGLFGGIVTGCNPRRVRQCV